MKDLITSLIVNLHILVVAVVLAGLGLGLIDDPSSAAKPPAAVISFVPPVTDTKPYVVASTTDTARTLKINASRAPTQLHI